MSKIILTGISTLPGDVGKQIVYFDVDHNDTVYHWHDYINACCGDDALQTLIEKESVYTTDIDAKEEEWKGAPKTTETEDGIIEIQKHDIVKPTPAKPASIIERLERLEEKIKSVE